MENLEAKFCRLCLNITKGKNFEIVDDVTRDILHTVVPQLNLNEGSKHVICSTCSVKLFAAFNFKSTCLYTDECIKTYLNSKDISTVDLREVCIKEEGNKQVIKMEDDQKICRLCMQLVEYEYKSLDEVERDLIHIYIPEVNFRVSNCPVICQSCFDLLGIYGGFIRSCLDAEGGMHNDKMDETRRCSPPSTLCIKTEETGIKSEDMRKWGLPKSEGNEIKTEDGEQLMKIEEVQIKSEKFEQDEQESSENDPLEMNWKNTSHTKRDIVTGGLSLQEPFNCCACAYKGKSESDLSRHMSIHRDCKLFTCPHCDHKEKYLSVFRRHMLKHQDPSEIQWYKCDICGHRTKYKDDLTKHMAKHTDPSKIEMHKCANCEYKTHRRYLLVKHTKVKHGDPADVQWFACDLCNFKSKYKNSLKTHLVYHKDVSQLTVYKCTECPYQTRRPKCLDKHKRTHLPSSQVKLKKCKFCSVKLKKDNMSRHVLQQHRDPSEARVFPCETCKYKAKRRYDLEIHMLKHADRSELQMFKCDSCEYEAKVKCNLVSHIKRMHSKSRKGKVD